jgi:hypothetical protein
MQSCVFVCARTLNTGFQAPFCTLARDSPERLE